MRNKSDPYYAAMLVEDARLHLGTVMDGQDSEPFFVSMLKLIEIDAHHGYTTLRNKRVELKGIKDFVHSVYYGLGVRRLEDFVLAVVKSAIKEKSRNRYASKFIDWLKDQDPAFKFPQEYFEYRRLMIDTAKNRRKRQYDKIIDYRTIKYLYQIQPSILEDIGPGRKYKDVQECYYAEGYGEKKQSLKPIKLFRNPTNLQLEEAGSIMFERFGPAKSRILALYLLGRCADERAARAGNLAAAGDDDAGRSEWA